MAGDKTASSSPQLTPLQRDVLVAFFERERGFFLSGGAALVGFHLHHRMTDDLDLFTVDPAAFERGPHALADVGRALGARISTRQDAPGFKRYAVERADGLLLVDLVLELSAQIRQVKPTLSGIVVDPPEEILANKLTTIVGRLEERDLVDLFYLERAGLRVETALEDALAKDGGCTPAALAWVLSQWTIPDDVRLPADLTPVELRAFLADLVARLRRAAAPRP